MPKLSICDRCFNYARDPHLVCAIHPSGVDGNFCPDYEQDPEWQPEEQWQPEGAAYYNGELVLQPEQRRTLQQKWELLDWHPMFTGRCPECEVPISVTDSVPWDCQSCGWKDDAV